MTLKELIEKEKNFARYGHGKWDSISLRDIDGETIKVYELKDIGSIKEEYMNAEFLSLGSSSLKPNRLRIMINIDV